MKISKPSLAIFFIILFTTMISAPSIIISVDDSVDVTIFYGLSEEEENENLEFLLDNTAIDTKTSLLDFNATNCIRYTFKTYSKPHLNLISPPPEFV